MRTTLLVAAALAIGLCLPCQSSTGRGRTTCAYYLQGDKRILYSSTHLADDNCPQPVFRVEGRYVWPIYETFDIFTARPDGTDLTDKAAKGG